MDERTQSTNGNRDQARASDVRELFERSNRLIRQSAEIEQSGRRMTKHLEALHKRSDIAIAGSDHTYDTP